MGQAIQSWNLSFAASRTSLVIWVSGIERSTSGMDPFDAFSISFKLLISSCLGVLTLIPGLALSLLWASASTSIPGLLVLLSTKKGLAALAALDAASLALKLKAGGPVGVTPVRLGLLGERELSCAHFAASSAVAGGIPGLGELPAPGGCWFIPPLAGGGRSLFMFT